MTKKPQASNIPSLLAELEQIEQYFRQPNLDLAKALVEHKRAIDLTQQIKKQLDEVEQTLEQIDISGLVKSTPNLEEID